MPPEVIAQVGTKPSPIHKPPSLYWGDKQPIGAKGNRSPLMMPAHHLTTHGCIVGMTGSGKTGLVFIAVEEALRNRVPVLMIDVKGDLPNLLLSFPDFEPHHLVPWVEGTRRHAQPGRASACHRR
jgi:Helicase HerA, central domain